VELTIIEKVLQQEKKSPAAREQSPARYFKIQIFNLQQICDAGISCDVY
jgi:hypothetical protein